MRERKSTRLFKFSASSVLLAIVCCTTAGSLAAQKRAPQRPNVILILADDIGIEGLNCYGGTSYKTPRLNQLASQGIRFTHAYAQPLCTNTRIQLMTGYYNHRNWLYFGCLDPRAKTIGHWMREAGYHTCIAGKWQLQSYDPPDYPGSELRRGKGMKVDRAGFDEFSLWHTAHTEDKGPRYADPVIFENGKFRKDTSGKYGEDIWVDFIQRFIKKHKDSERPFFVYYPMALPHWPFVPTPRSKDWGIKEKMHPPLGTTGGDTKYFPDMVHYMDEVVGRMVDTVDALGLAEKTLILFVSDNGTDRRVVSQTLYGSIPGGKGATTNAGTHVPFIARWKGTIKPGVNDDLIDTTDFLPTMLAAAGKTVDPKLDIDGRSFYPQLLGQRGMPRQWTFCHYDPRPGWDKDKFTRLQYARTKRFKLYEDGRLYDITHDVREETAIAPNKDTSESKAARAYLSGVIAKMNAKPQVRYSAGE